MKTFADAQRNVRYHVALLVIEIGKAIMKLGFRVTDAGVEVTRRGAVMRRDNQELPKP
jgi:hypothetical protein